MQRFELYDESALLDRLTHGLLKSERSAVFLVGSAVSTPTVTDKFGVPGVDGVIEIIRSEFLGTPAEREFENVASEFGGNRYQAAFQFLIGRRGQQFANEVIRRAVWQARKQTQYVPSRATSEDFCRKCDTDTDGWVLPPAIRAVGALIAKYPTRFGRTALTTNFDPLLGVSIGTAGGFHFRTVLHGDGNIGQTDGNGCHVVHLHGYWYGADTLHTPRQLSQPRPQLKASLSSLIRGKTLVISGYGGWPDAFMQALAEVALDNSAYPEIIWTFRDRAPTINEDLANQLSPAADRGRVSFYGGIDCHDFFPKLLETWEKLEPPAPPTFFPPISYRLQTLYTLPSYTSFDRSIGGILDIDAALLEGRDEDRPPLIDICVGRDNELSALTETEAPACFITGLGGQGKSTLAAKYFSEARLSKCYDLFVWRDCKEEKERLEIQIVSIIEKLTDTRIRAKDISTQPIEVLAELLVKHANGRRILFVFDNVDHYVDLENNKLSPAPEKFLEAFLAAQSNSRIIFTCRPTINYPNKNVFSARLSGLSLGSTQELFAKRGAVVSRIDLEDAHTATAGHAFWLDLLAAQIVKNPNLKLADLLKRSDRDVGDIPMATLQSIWNSLVERDKIVLQALAESVRPETEPRLGDYLKNSLRYNKVVKALNSLRSLNLIVVKAHPESDDVVELHPLVRNFVHRNFGKQERLPFITAIIDVYQRFLGLHKPELARRPRLEILQNWTQAAELDIQAGRFNEAFSCMNDVATAFAGGGYPGEYARVAEVLFKAFEWNRHFEIATFDNVLSAYARILIELGRFEETDQLLDSFARTMPIKDARYILYCDLQTYSYWARQDFSTATKWGRTGEELKEATSVDTKYSCLHNLALAQRDGGNVDPALETFLAGGSLDQATDPDELDEKRGGAYYGNVGRCLHLMGQIDPAIICYRKSAILIEKDATHEHVVNQGFIRLWIGELLLKKGEYCSAKYFLEAASAKWEQVSPTRSKRARGILEETEEAFHSCPNLGAREVERYCVAWIYGRESEFC